MGIVFLQAGTLSPGTGASPGAGDTDLSLLVHPSAPAVRCAMLVPSRPPHAWLGEILFPPTALAVLFKSSLLEGKFALDSAEPPTPGGRSCVYRCTYSVPQPSFLPLASTAQARDGERPSQSGPDATPQRPSTPPCKT